MSKRLFEGEEPEQTEAKRDTLNTISTEGGEVIERLDREVERGETNLFGATFKGKIAYVIKDFINSDRITNRALNALGIVGYTIQITYEGRKWKFSKRRKEFGQLHDKIVAQLKK